MDSFLPNCQVSTKPGQLQDDLSPQDRLAVVSFSSRPHQVSGLTSDHASLRDALKDAMNERLRVREPTAAVREASDGVVPSC